MHDAPTVRPFTSASEYAAMVDYFRGGGPEVQRAMGIDPARVPTREAWLADLLVDHERPDDEKERLYVAWYLGQRLVGHSSLSHVDPGVRAHCHLHLWDPDLRRAGLGPRFLAASIDLYFERFDLSVMVCEPRAENPAPNRALPKLGFRLVKRYRTVPTSMAYEQDINRWEITREEWRARARPEAP